MNFLLLLILSGQLGDTSAAVPNNATTNRFGIGWTCNSGFKRVGDTCARIEVPPNGKLNYFGTDWECNSGFARVGAICSRIAIPPNGKLNYFGTGWECNSGYKVVSGSCVAMNNDEIAQAEARQRAIVAAVAARRSSFASGNTCETEPKSGAEVCLSITNVDIDCSKSYTGTYYRSCDATVSYNLETDFKGRGYIDVDVECYVEIAYNRKNYVSSSNDSTTKDVSTSLYANGSDSESMDFYFSFSSYAEVNRVRVSSHRCKIDEISLY
jgi:hypothetical protein